MLITQILKKIIKCGDLPATVHYCQSVFLH